MTDPRVVRAIVELETHLAEVDPEQIHAESGLSAPRFARLFATETGLSPAGYLFALRMERARTLLERTFLSVQQVMTQVGFADRKQFARDFRQYHGRSPRSIRMGHSDNQRSRFLTAHVALMDDGRERRE